MRVKLNKLLTLSTITIISLSSILIFRSDAEEPTTKIYLVPSRIIYDTSNGTIGTRFNITLWVQDVTDLAAWQVQINYSDAIINATRWFEPTWDNQYVFYGKTTMAVPSDQPHPDGGYYLTTYFHTPPNEGKITVGTNRFPPPLPGQGFSGTGKLAIIEFNITALPPEDGRLSCVLGIDNPNTYLLNSIGGEIAATKENGYYEISGLMAPPPPVHDVAVIAVTPSKTSAVEGEILTISVTVKNKGNVPETFDVKAKYDTNIIGTQQASNLGPGATTTLDFMWDTTGIIGFFVISAEAVPVPEETNLGDNSLSDGMVRISPKVTERARIFVDPPEIVDPTMRPSSTFSINITIDDVENLQVCTYNLTYETNVIGLIGLNFFKVFDEYPIYTMVGDEEAGFIWMNLTYKTPVTVASPTALVKLTFHVELLGSSILDLHDTIFTNSTGEPIPHDEQDGYFSALIRDVAITNVIPSRNWVYRGQPINVTVTALNKGNVSETFDVKAYYNTSLVGTITVYNLPPGETADLIFTWDTTGVEEGNYTIKAEAMPVPYEFNTTDNEYVDGMVWVIAIIHDVAIINVIPSSNWAYQGWLVNVTVTALNKGNVSETFDVKAYYDNNLIGIYTVIDLAPNEIVNITFTWNTNLVEPCHNYTIKGEASIVPYELSTEDNIYVDGKVKIRYMGDVNGDGYVDMKDIYAVSLAFASYPGHPRWNPEADFNQDNLIDIKDVYTVAINFNKGCP
ncbi:MAG: CARDB domain-containing protein [Candidatus Bathyarchaeia archaeon]